MTLKQKIEINQASETCEGKEENFSFASILLFSLFFLSTQIVRIFFGLEIEDPFINCERYYYFSLEKEHFRIFYAAVISTVILIYNYLTSTQFLFQAEI